MTSNFFNLTDCRPLPPIQKLILVHLKHFSFVLNILNILFDPPNSFDFFQAKIYLAKNWNQNYQKIYQKFSEKKRKNIPEKKFKKCKQRFRETIYAYLL